MNDLSRRSALRLFGVSVAGVGAGCASVPILNDNQESEYEPGALVVINKHSLAHVVGISVNGPEPTENQNVSGEALRIIETGLEGQIPVDAGETKVYPDFLSGSIMYAVKMWLGTAEAETPPNASHDDNVGEAKFSPDATGTRDARGSYLTVRVKPGGKLSWHVTYVY